MPDRNQLARSHSGPAPQGFTRLELLVVLATLGLLAAIALPVLAGSRPISERVSCLNNLRRVGQAFQMWASDHNDKHPWAASPAEGGNRDFNDLYNPPMRGNVWFQFAWISNELTTAKILACPSDQQTKPAKDFSTSLDGGYVNPSYRNGATSYFISVHSLYEKPRSLLSGDRNIYYSYPSACSVGFNYLGNFSPFSANWLNGAHGQTGNILLTDGQVLSYSSPALIVALSSPAIRGSGSYHLLFVPR